MRVELSEYPFLYDAVHYVAFNLSRALTPFRWRDSPIYWPFVLSSLVIAFAAWLAVRRSWKGFGDAYFTRRLWWHPSACADYKLYALNALLMPGLLALALLDEGEIRGMLQSGGGGAHGVLAGVAFTLVFFVAYDFGRFVAHCLLHDVPFLWEIHKVHHAAEVLTPMTGYRAHPVELLVMAWGGLAATALATYLFSLLVPGAITAYTFLGLHVIIWAFSLIDNLRHSPVWISYGPALGRWLISPAHHQLHHSCEPHHMGCNRGFELALWDRLYGTLYVPGFRKEEFRLGLGDGSEARYHSAFGMYVLPMLCAGREAQQALRRLTRRPAV